MQIHLWPNIPFSFRCNTATLRKRALQSPEVWLELACMLHNAEYRFFEFTEREDRAIRRVRSVVESCVPDKYRKGVFPTGKHTANCGEAMYVVDGEIDHVMWLRCARCDKSEVVHRFHDGAERSSGWCTKCNDYVETKSLSESHEQEGLHRDSP